MASVHFLTLNRFLGTATCRLALLAHRLISSSWFADLGVTRPPPKSVRSFCSPLLRLTAGLRRLGLGAVPRAGRFPPASDRTVAMVGPAANRHGVIFVLSSRPSQALEQQTAFITQLIVTAGDLDQPWAPRGMNRLGSWPCSAATCWAPAWKCFRSASARRLRLQALPSMPN